VPGLSLPISIKENVTVNGKVVTLPEAKLAFSQGGIPEIEKLTLSNVDLSR
jgi:hypothetical protein